MSQQQPYSEVDDIAQKALDVVENRRRLVVGHLTSLIGKERLRHVRHVDINTPAFFYGVYTGEDDMLASRPSFDDLDSLTVKTRFDGTLVTLSPEGIYLCHKRGKTGFYVKDSKVEPKDLPKTLDMELLELKLKRL